ncbi:ABC transporter ATP-binding protein [Lentilactobacillus fungorum]|uniref:ABC transporter ATP-binding protein n=1 Tax=Lentilactobacillus fungorum TaxID=2201250 RepID=A0ABQ3W1S1_9LACO|nr:ABC transporter ATP-binding protein [Lentilactobacillus fungorum]GHP14387.1 ABC transporter ATP-binding protein [Lentilactobacillus fungorum]
MNDPIIKAQHLAKSFGKQLVIKDVSLELKQGDIYGFLGTNGSGKSTTMKLLLGLLKPDGGDIKIFGKELRSYRDTILRNTGALIEEPSFYPNLTGNENLQIMKDLLGLPPRNVTEALRIVDLVDAKDKLVQNYSLGMKQRLGIALALVKFPKLLILDEPTNGLDPEGMHQIRELIKTLPKEYGMTVLISSHLLSEMEQMAQTVGIIQNGQLIYQGNIHELTKSQRYFLTTSDPRRSQAIVNKSGGTNILNQGANVISFNLSDKLEVPVVVKRLVAENIDIFSLYGKHKSLEDVFLELTGGD